ncbi:DUF3363 domain-containing protein [Bradyrhizobium sp. 191]|uniref:DUF3363 domain-containing protein n=1 Tax=Bradyrhizobium sp. 191 TaxID=2782659 RepID=UPI001FFE4911|nr:DUF3363 domain-containing protein [Bradyrhizobium sp. 191]
MEAKTAQAAIKIGVKRQSKGPQRYAYGELASLRSFTRELMDQASRDLGTRLDWVAVDHWNTEHPHIHILVRGRTDDGADLVISRDYIAMGLRARASDLVTRELGPRSELEIRQSLEADTTAERWTRLDRTLAREAGTADGVIDLRFEREAGRDPLREIRIGRMRTLERLGLAEPGGPAVWVLAADAEARLRALGERGDIIKRLHKTLTRDGASRTPASWALEGETHGEPIVGRLIARGLDDELKGTAFAIVDGIDGRVHHVKLSDVEAAGDGPIGGIVELRRFADARGRTRIALAVRSELVLDQQVAADGATWLDRQLVARDPAELSRNAFGAEVRAALERRIDVLADQGLAQRDGNKVRLRRNLIETLRDRELDVVTRRLMEETGRPHLSSDVGEQISGVYRRRLSLASGRFAMIDNGLGFQLVPWSPSLERELGKQVSGIAGPGSVDWDFGRKRGLSL